MIRWFSRNHVAANLLMATILVFGAMSALTIKQEVFPDTDLDIVSIQVPYLGGTPAEVEESVNVRVEEQIQGIDGVKKITSTAVEGMGTVLLELQRDASPQEVLDDVKAAVDRIITFPAETEKPIVTLLERRQQVIDLVLSGDIPERALKELAEKVRDDLVTLDHVTYAEIVGTRPYEISIEVSEQTLRAHGLTLGDVTQAVRTNSLDLPGGRVKTAGGEVLVRTKGQRYTGEEFGEIVVITRPDGTEVTLDQIAVVRDQFEDVDTAGRLDGKPAATIAVYRTGEAGVLEVAGAVKDYVAEQRDLLPAGVAMTTWFDRSEIYRDRMNLLIKNGTVGLILVFVCLAAFLQMRLAFWVALGILISFLGAFMVLPWFGVSLNMLSMFAFIVSLGIVVDDAIVVGENVFAHRERGRRRQAAATLGALEVAAPVTFAVLTTVVAFLPLAFVEGMMGKFMYAIPVVVIAVLLFSLVESLLILPAHLSSIKGVRPQGAEPSGRTGRGGPGRWYAHGKADLQARLQRFVNGTYRKHLDWGLTHRGLVLALAVGGFLVTMGMVMGGHLRFTFMPRIDSDNLVATVTLPQGTTVDDARRAVEQIEAGLAALKEEVGAASPEGAPSIFEHTFTTIGSQPRVSMGPHGGSGSDGGAHLLEVNAELVSSADREMSSSALARRWRELTGPIPGAVAVSFSADLFGGGKALQVQLSSSSTDDLVAAAQRLKQELAVYPGVSDIEDSFREGKVELKLGLKPEARTLGLTLADLARQVRAGFYGDEAMRIQRGRDEVKVMVRYPEEERRSIGDIENMRVRTPAGAEVPFHRVARVDEGRGYAAIERSDRKRVVNVSGDVDQAVTNAGEVVADLQAAVLPRLAADYPGLRYGFEGEEQDRAESMASLGRGALLAVMMIYVLLAVLFRSYAQPLIVMSAIPFGFMGAVLGHLIMRWDLTLLSMFGVVALTGVVVNDSLIMIDFINRARREGMDQRQAILQAGTRRFRPIMLTSVTTFAGLTPLLLETSLQARFLIPMAISLGFGVVFATLITLMLVPVLYAGLADLKRWLGFRTVDQVAADEAEELEDLSYAHPTTTQGGAPAEGRDHPRPTGTGRGVML
ncbi:MAG: efflux RND transporter permease subunit [Candidatus Krumholzibacteriia bacterium]